MENFEEFASQHLKSEHWSIVLQFLCGILWDDNLALNLQNNSICNKLEKRQVLSDVLKYNLMEAKDGYQTLGIYMSLYETKSRSLVTSLLHNIVLCHTVLNRYSVQIIGWLISCGQMEAVSFEHCIIYDEEILDLVQELQEIEKKPHIELLDIEGCLSIQSLNLLMERLTVDNLNFFPVGSVENLTYSAFNWKNMHELFMLTYLECFSVINDHNFAKIASNHCVNSQGVFCKENGFLHLAFDSRGGLYPHYCIRCNNYLEKFFDPNKISTLLRGEFLQQVIELEDLKKTYGNILGKVSEVLLYCSPRDILYIDSSDISSFASQFGCGTFEVVVQIFPHYYNYFDVKQAFPITKLCDIQKYFSQSDIKCSVYFCGLLQCNELSLIPVLFEQNPTENICLLVNYQAEVEDLKLLIHRCRFKQLILVKGDARKLYAPWSPSCTDENDILNFADQIGSLVKIVGFDDLNKAWQSCFWTGLPLVPPPSFGRDMILLPQRRW